MSVRPDDVTVGDAGANMGKLYRIQKMLQNFEHLKAIITVAEIPFVLVNAMKWQNDLKLRIKVKGKRRKRQTANDGSGILPGNYTRRLSRRYGMRTQR